MRNVTIYCKTRDEKGSENGSLSTDGVTDDDGATCAIGLGYLPQLIASQAGDVRVTLHEPHEEVEVAVESVQKNLDHAIQIIKFTKA